VLLGCVVLPLVLGMAVARAESRAHTLSVTLRGRNKCLRDVRQWPLGRITRPSDQFELVSPAPKHSNTNLGRLLARPFSVLSIRNGCAVVVRFRIPSTLGRFSFYDKSDGGIWFGFNSANLPERGWRLTIIERDCC
jgi:hypothetical protein